MKDRIQDSLNTVFAGDDISIEVDGNRCLVRIISDQFEGLRVVQRQQKVYACLNELISSGELHAVTLQTHTVAEVNEA